MRTAKYHVQRFTDREEAARNLVDVFVEAGRCSMREKRRFTVALSGGRTPQAFFQQLAEEAGRNTTTRDIVNATHYFWVDERYVPADHGDSNYGAVMRELFSKVNVDGAHIHPMPTGGKDAERGAACYGESLAAFFDLPKGEFPAFDLMLLGMGEDGHIASLFPGSPTLREDQRWVLATPAPKAKSARITLTVPVIQNASKIIVMVTGAPKANALYTALCGDFAPYSCPAQYLRKVARKVCWYVDTNAVRLIDKKSPVCS